jgi:hypothetical protein
MSHDVEDPMEAEFGTVAEWTAQVAADLGPEYYIPAACRGSGQPAALDWLLEGMHPRPGELMLDVGAGVGGAIGLLVFLATTGRLDDPPQGNHFPASAGLHALAGRARLDVVAVADAQDMPEPPASWRQRTAAVERELQRHRGSTPQLAAAEEQSGRIGRLLRSGELTSQVLLLRGK